MDSAAPIQCVLDRLEQVQRSGKGFAARCPAHEDRKPSLSIQQGEDGRVLMHCHAGCTLDDICAAIGIRPRDLFPESPSHERIVATYDYTDQDGTLLYQVVRYEPKGFRQRRPRGQGNWVWKLNGVPRVLYRLRDIQSADRTQWTFIVEGEKDVDSLWNNGLAATTNPGGAGKWDKLSDDSALHGRRIGILPDNDERGKRHASDVASRLHGHAAEVRIISLPGPVKDVTDWFESGGDKEQLLTLAESAPVFAPTAAEVLHADAQDGNALVALGQRDPATGRLVLSPKQTLPTAQAYVNEFHFHREGCTLCAYADVLMEWKDNRYIAIEDAAIKHRLQSWLHVALRYVRNYRSGRMELVDFDSNPMTVNQALESIRCHIHLSATTTLPSWLAADQGRPPAGEILCCRSLNLHLPTEQILPITPALFTTSALEFDYEENPNSPVRWLSFLEQLWGDDQASIQLLQEWMGLCLTPDTSQQKMLLLFGPRRSGKGTIARVLAKLVGANNVAGPTTGSLAGMFGLQPLIGKSLAIVSDARFAGRDLSTVVERLLCISGEDQLTIDRKYLPSVHMKLPTRFMFLTNELPCLSDASTALAGRFMLLRLNQSFFGKEDPRLIDGLLDELPGILQWSIVGWKGLRKRGRFVQPPSVEQDIWELEALASPVKAFVEERCEIGPGLRVTVDSLYDEWSRWCTDDGRSHTSTKQMFGRDLAAAFPGIRRRRGTGQVGFYEGIDLRRSDP